MDSLTNVIHEPKREKVPVNCFLDVLTLRSILFLLRKRRELSSVCFFECSSRLAAATLRLFSSLKLIRFPVVKNHLYFGDMLATGRRKLSAINKEIDEYCANVIERYCEISHVVTCGQKITDREDLVKRYLLSELMREMAFRLRQVYMYEWHAERQSMQSSDVVIATRFDQTGCLSEFIRRFGFQHVTHSSFSLKITKVGRLAQIALQIFLLLCRVISSYLFEKKRSNEKKSSDSKHPVIAHHYSGSLITTKITKKMEMPWMLSDAVSYDQLIVVGYKYECSDESIRCFIENGAQFFECGTHLRRLGLQNKAHMAATKKAFILFTVMLRAEIFGQKIGLFLMQRLLLATIHETYWRVFYDHLNVKVITSFYFNDVTQVMAIDALNGFSVTYQDSIANHIRQPLAYPKSHVVCAVSNSIIKSYAASELGHVYLSCGYSYPIQRAVSDAGSESAELRRILEEHGANFVVCFFDENIRDNWFNANPRETISLYKELFQLVLDNPKIGLVCKPKVMHLLLQRLEPIRSVLDQAIATGRVHIFLSNNKCRCQYPATAAASADLCIGRVGGWTALLEGALIGKPGIAVNAMHKESPVPDVNLDGRVTFASVEELITALRRELDSPGSIEGFGDWSPWLPKLISYDDDDGPERIGDVLGWLLELAVADVSQEQALDEVARRFADSWGQDKVTLADGLRRGDR